MGKTPGVIIPSLFSSKSDLKKDLERRDTENGFTPFNLEFFMHSSEDAGDFFEHHGIKGQRWGIRHDPKTGGISRSTDRMAKKDAEEFARAHLFYGQGAGTRRKLINATVKERSKDPAYKKAFDAHFAKQDMSRHASKAVNERNRIDRKIKTKQRAGFIARRFTGEMGTQAAFTAVALGGAAFVASPKGKAILSKSFNTVKTAAHNQQLQRRVNKLIKNSMG